MIFTRNFFLAVNVVLIWTIAGCSQELKPSTLPTSTVTLTPTASPISFSPTASLTPAKSCPIIDPNVKFTPAISNNDEIANAVLDFINIGGDINQINSYYSQFSFKSLDVLAIDLNEDGLKEVVLAGVLPLELNARGDGGIYIFGCEQGYFSTIKKFDTQPMSSANILRSEKLLAAYPQQVIIKYILSVGWGSYFLAIGYINRDWQIIFEDTGFLPEFISYDLDNDGNKEIAIHSITNTTQGTQRTQITTFKWNGQTYSPTSFQLMRGTTRVDYLDDAQIALDKGDMSMAIANYERAAHDLNLGGFSSRGEIEKHQTTLSNDYQISFALFRLAVLWFSMGDDETGTRLTQEMLDEFPLNSPGGEFTQAIVIFQDEFNKGKTPIEACNAVSEFLTESFPYLNIHIGDWGMMMTSYETIDELCPFH